MENLFQDGLHLNDDEEIILANNVLSFKQVFLMKRKKIITALVRMILYSKQIFITTMMSFPTSQIVLK